MSSILFSVKKCLSWQGVASGALAVGSTLLVSSCAPDFAATIVQGAAAVAIAATSAFYLNALGKEGENRLGALVKTGGMVLDSYKRAEEKFHSLSSQGESSNAQNTTAKKISENIQWAAKQSSDTFKGMVKLVGADGNEVLIGSAAGGATALLTGYPLVAMTSAGLTVLVMEGRKETPELPKAPIAAAEPPRNRVEEKGKEEQSSSSSSAAVQSPSNSSEAVQPPSSSSAASSSIAVLNGSGKNLDPK